MMSFRWRLFVLLLLAHLTVAAITAQTRPSDTPSGTATISGRVTAQGKPLVGLHLVLQASNLPNPTGTRTVTDVDGRYQFSGLAAGAYQIRPLSPIYVTAGDLRLGPIGQAITLSEGENVTNVDLALIRGGVVTGKVVDSEGRPLIECYVQFDQLDSQGRGNPVFSMNPEGFQTDDRGIYRAIGLQPGRYRVSTGEGEGSVRMSVGGRKYPRTFHPDAGQVESAAIIEVAEGGELTGIDIRLRPRPKTFTIAGRALDAETNEPVSNVNIVLITVTNDGRPSGGMRGNAISGATGDFLLEDVQSGRYSVFVGPRYAFPQADNPRYSDPTTVEVLDGDATGVEVRVKRGGVISGLATIEGTADPAIIARLPQQRVQVMVETAERVQMPLLQMLSIGRDGAFRLEGVRPGRARISHSGALAAGAGLTLLRIERDGARVDLIEVGPEEQVGGIKLVFAYGTGIVRGQVVVKGSGLSENPVFFVSARRIDATRPIKSTRSDARGRFSLEELPPGEFEISAQPYLPNLSSEMIRRVTTKQTVTVSNGQAIQLTLTIDLTRQEEKQ